ncbi:ROK family protein [uncultured Polaribacter sp.]|uniref:ROK family protein n=1 Tax=uncultured Polaribacter sp. TaxID=174711 RepID=UPI0026375659|nr:ROK family protein [uncultured Polaribacter sp.]
MELVVGIDIGGTKTKIGLVNKDGDSIVHDFFRTKEYPNIDDFILKIKAVVNQLIAKTTTNVSLLGVGIGAPNASSKKGTIENAANLVWKGSTPIVAKLKEHMNLPIKLMNDASAATLGEMLFGHAKGMQDFILITLGTGLGSGIVANGKLIDGFNGFAGELGHVDIATDGMRLTGLGVKGGLEAYVSATGLKRTIMYMLSIYMEDSIFRNIAYNDLHGEDITKAAEEGDFIAIKAFDYTCRILGKALANFTTFSQPEAFFLLGGLTSSDKWIFEGTKKYMEEYLLEIYKGDVKILPSGMHGKNAAISGAAALIWQDFKNK